MKLSTCQLLFAALFLVREAFAAECVVKKFADVPKAIATCQNIVLDSLRVPAGQSLVLPLRNATHLKFRGRTVFEYAVWAGPLVAINASNVTIEGEPGSVLDGQGALYWDGSGESGSLKPTFFNIQLYNSEMYNINVLNMPSRCVVLVDSTDVTIYHWNINNTADNKAVADKIKSARNTDAFEIRNGTNIFLIDHTVYNQDYCVAIRSGYNIFVAQFTCHSGNGFGVSVGFSNAKNTLENVIFTNSILVGGENAIHIETHADAGPGLVRNITYDNVEFGETTKYGLNIRQNRRNSASKSKNSIPIKDLHLIDVTGFVEEQAVPISIQCAENGCFDWRFKRVKVKGTKPNSCNFVPNGFKC